MRPFVQATERGKRESGAGSREYHRRRRRCPSLVLPGFTASFDYYNIDITNGINSILPQQIVNLCFSGNQTACALVTSPT